MIGLILSFSHLYCAVHRDYILLVLLWASVCIVQPRSRLRSFDVPYIFYSKFSKSRARNLQTFQSGKVCPKRLVTSQEYNISNSIYIYIDVIY